MSGKPIEALNSRANFVVKATYYAYGYNDLVDMLPGLPSQMKVDAMEFGKLYSEQFADAEHVINIQDCFKMYLSGKRVFKRE